MDPTTEPVRLGTLILGVVNAVLVLVVAFGVNLSGDQQQAVLGAVGAVISLGAALGIGHLIRSRVTPLARPKDNAGRRALVIPEDIYSDLVRQVDEATGPIPFDR